MESSRNPVLVDPLSDFSLVSLFPRTFNQLVLDPDPNSRHSDPLEAFGAHLEALALKNPNGLLEQAKSILDGGVEILNHNNLVNGTGADTIGNHCGVNNVSLQRDSENLKNAGDKDLGGNHENALARRPALGRKRPRFTLKPNSSQSTESLKPFLDIKKLADPEEFFAAFERHENVMNELRRQSGKPLVDLDQNVPLIAEKRRRPGLLRRSAIYKHRYPKPSGDAETFLSSQETLSQDLCSPSPSNNCLQTQKIDQVSAGKERPGGVNDEIPTSPDKDDESDEIIGMLHKRFKPVEISKSCLPELDSALQSEFMTVAESLHDLQYKMPDLQAIVSTIANESPLGCNNLERRSGHPSTSPQPPKSPHSSISLLKARLFQHRKGKDPFSNVDVDLSPVGKNGSCEDTHNLQKLVKDSNISTVNSMIIESGCRSGVSDARGTNLKSPMHEGSDFTSTETNKGDSTKSGIPSGSLLQMELEDDFVQLGESDVNPISPLHEKERDTSQDMQATQDISKTSGVYSDVEMHTESDDAIQRIQSPKPAAHETERNVVHDKNIHDFDADNLAPAEKNVKDYSMGSGIELNMTPDPELDHDIMPHNTTGGVMEDYPSGVMEDYPSKVSDASVISVDDHMEPDHGVLEKDLDGCNIEKSHCELGIALNMTPGAELDHEIMPHNTTGGVMEDDLGKVSDDPASKVSDAVVSDAVVISVDDHMEPDHGMLDEDMEGCNMEKSHCFMDQSSANTVEDHGDDIRLSSAKDKLEHDRPSSSLAHPLKKTQKACSKAAERDRSKTREPAERRAIAAKKYARERKEFSRRKSLAACGTQWEAGIRRSTRIRSRPLEFWNGERQLYGRIHEALATVVGTKYFSPTKEAGQAALKIKSYVSDDYKEIVERAALH